MEGYIEKGIRNQGNLYRIISCMKKAKNGAPVRIAFIGGSITEGTRATRRECCYAYRVYHWWVQKFPMAEIQYVNAGIGGTSSQFGAARVQEDVLVHEPDVVFIEFSVNDENTEHFQETYEGLIRKTYQAPSAPAVVLIHSARYDEYETAEEVHVQVGKYYNLPCVSMKRSVRAAVDAGKIDKRQITEDDLHPNDLGHEWMAKVIISFLEQAYEKLQSGEYDLSNRSLQQPMTLNQYEASTRYQKQNADYKLEGFAVDNALYEEERTNFRNGFTAWNVGDRITLWVEGTGIAVQYRKSVRRPAPVAKVTVDGREELTMILDANFDQDWGDCLHLDTVCKHGEDRMHRVEICIIEAHEEDVVPFYLVSVIGSR